MQPAVRALFERQQWVLIAGPCVIESWEVCAEIAQTCQQLCQRLGIPYIFKASFDKANRTSHQSARGLGMAHGLETLAAIRQTFQVPVLTDIHEPSQAAQVAEVVDVLQIPAFLCRQTDLLQAAAQTKCPTNIKKGQFLHPQDMAHVVQKFRQAGGTHVAVTERGTCFGYRDLVVDMRSLPWLHQATGAPVIFDATHSVQQIGGGKDGTSGGIRHFAPILARAAAAVGIDGLFCEVHPNPEQAWSDGPNALTLPMLAQLLTQLLPIIRPASWPEQHQLEVPPTVAAARALP